MSNKKRLMVFGMFIFAIFFSLAIRLYNIQVIKSPTYSELALKQRSSEISLHPNRGIIYDRNLESLTNKEKEQVIIIPKDIIINDKDVFDIVLNHSKLSKNQLDKIIRNGNNLLQIKIDEEFDLGKYNNRMFCRYNKEIW